VKARPQRPIGAPRPRGYYLVAGIDLGDELTRLRRLPVFATGPLAAAEPQLKIRRASRKPNRLGFAVPGEFRISVTAYPGMRQGDLLETLLHELVHLHVGRRPGGHAWHGRLFKRTLSRAMREAYGIWDLRPPSTRHGVYAAAIEAQLAAEGGQLRLLPAAEPQSRIADTG
jgi:hypothetical protein